MIVNHSPMVMGVLMNRIAYQKVLLFFIAGALLLGFYDVLLHALLYIIHSIFEWIELALEEIIEHLFHTSRQQTQLIVFYLLLLIGTVGLYRLWLVLLVYSRRLKEQLIDTGKQYQQSMHYYWHEQTLIKKIRLLSTCALSFSFLLLFTFS
ncbi:MAG: hypothetical protein ABL925_00875 [Methylococcales bacterium]